MDRPKLLLHVVRCEKIKDRSQLQKQVVFEAKDWCRSNKGGLREDASGNFLTTSLMNVVSN